MVTKDPTVFKFLFLILPTLTSFHPLANFWPTLKRKVIKQVTKEACGIIPLPPEVPKKK